jgi:hypothetical protein
MKKKLRNTILKILLLQVFTSTYLLGQKDEVLLKIHQEAEMNSQIMKTVSYLSDVYGSRLMGTPNYYSAVQWAEKQLKNWGIEKTYLQSFDKGHRGWEVKSFQMEMVEPVFSHIIAYPLAYTASTNGTQTGEVIYVPNFDTLYALSGQIKNKIILLGSFYEKVKNVDYALSRRLSDKELENAKNNPDPNDVIIGYHSRRSTSQVFSYQNLIRKQKEKFFNFCKQQKVLAIIEPSDFPYGILHADGNRAIPSYMRKQDITPIASFVIANEHFGRLVRLIKLGYKPQIKLNLDVKFYNEPKYNVNLIAEIKGTDPNLQDEIVIIGAHLDSWHSGTGAVDNASGCATMMEALRILKTTGVQPKRTIRLALWGGEEQIFAGSSAYIEQNVGDLKSAEPKGEKSKISAYFNLDNGAGKIRGIYLMANEGVKPIFEKYLKPFESNNILTLQNANQTDHELFDYQNIPAFQFIQDPLDYMTAIHHTNMDLYEYVPEKDQKFNAELIAYLVYQVAQSEDLLPRKKFNSPIPSLQGNAEFNLRGYSEAKQVNLVGDFNNWNMFGTPMAKTIDGWECKIDLPKGKYVYKFIIDGDWTSDPNTPKDKLVKDGKGHAGLTEKEIN